MGLALLGFGTVGSAFYSLVRQRSDVNVSVLLSRRPRAGLGCPVTDDYDTVLSDPSVDTVVELIGGTDPAFEYIIRALRAGKNVVTANKQVLAARLPELSAEAKSSGVFLRFSAAAGGGIPWIPSLLRAALSDRVLSVSGIMNGTSAFILSEMRESGASYGRALERARELGYAEADPSADVEGLDARRKLAISASLASGSFISEDLIPCIGISSAAPEDIKYAESISAVLKPFAFAEFENGATDAFVCPALFPALSQEGLLRGPENLFRLRSESLGPQSFCGAGAGGFATAANVLADCLSPDAPPLPSFKALSSSSVPSGAKIRQWLFRSGGKRFFAEYTAKDASALYEKLKKEDQNTFAALMAKGEKHA